MVLVLSNRLFHSHFRLPISSLANMTLVNNPCGARHLNNYVADISHTTKLDANTQQIFDGLIEGKRQSLARAITLVETTNKVKAASARQLINHVTQHCTSRAKELGRPNLAFRLGLSGPPGAGKSTFIEAFGKQLTAAGNRVAVLAVDPSSGTTGGSLLGDKTRMPELTVDPKAYIRPSPSRGHLGGVTRTTNEAILLCEAAGYNIVLVETVGVGQSEYMVANMVDMFCLILPPAGGDELQGIKRGIVEQSDMIVINKCDGDLVPAARRIAYEYTSALKYMRPRWPAWRTKVKLCSARTGEGLDKVWEVMKEYEERLLEDGELVRRRSEQHRRWMWSYVEERLVQLARQSVGEGNTTAELEADVRNGKLPPGTAADYIIDAFLKKTR